MVNGLSLGISIFGFLVCGYHLFQIKNDKSESTNRMRATLAIVAAIIGIVNLYIAFN